MNEIIFYWEFENGQTLKVECPWLKDLEPIIKIKEAIEEVVDAIQKIVVYTKR